MTKKAKSSSSRKTPKTKQAAAKKAAAKKTDTKKSVAKKAPPKKTVAKKTAAKKTTAKKTAMKKATPKKDKSKKAAPKKTAANKTTAKKTTMKKATPKKDKSKKTAAKKTAAKKATIKKTAVSKKTTGKKAAKGTTVSKKAPAKKDTAKQKETKATIRKKATKKKTIKKVQKPLKKKAETKGTVAKKPVKKKKTKEKAPAKKVQIKKTATPKKKKSQAKGKKAPQKKFPDKKQFKKLITDGKKQGYLTYDQIYAFLPEDQQTAERFDDTIMLLDDKGIKVVDGTQLAKVIKKAKDKKAAPTVKALPDFGTVTDPVKMYLREMGLVTLLSREGEVEIAKKIEAGEQDVLKSLLETKMGVEFILKLGEHIKNIELRPKHVLRDVDEGDNYIDEVVQIEHFTSTTKLIAEIHDENHKLREKLRLNGPASNEQRKIRRSIARRNNKIFHMLKTWRFEAIVVDKIEADIRKLNNWYDDMN